ncbi:glycosyl transferase [Bergeyella porcorum]|uniref:Glycosyl transferase n=2 Tax=Bergeyella porcorum TaxID=1735111 RepID=A0AAU0F2R8_9FLAO
MTAVVLREFLEQNPNVEIIMVSRANFFPLFEGIDRLHFKGINLDEYKGFWGLRRLGNALLKEFQPDYIADLHDVLRTKILKRFFKLKGIQVSVIDKGKEDKQTLTDVWNLNKTQLKSTTERYADVLRALGFQVKLSHQYRVLTSDKSGIGFAPFAQHKGKMLPLEKSFELLKILSQYKKVIFLEAVKRRWRFSHLGAAITECGELGGETILREEIEKIATLEVMISMDSANMHLASLAGTRCISVWGATHHYAGFLGYGQSEADIVSVEDLTCRPCSVFGDKPCYRGDYACLNEIDIHEVIKKVGIENKSFCN